MPTSELFTDKELEEIVRRENLGENPEMGSVDKAIGLVRAHVKISPLSSRSFLVTYRARDRHLAQKVNTALVAFLIQRKSRPSESARGRRCSDVNSKVRTPVQELQLMRLARRLRSFVFSSHRACLGNP